MKTLLKKFLRNDSGAALVEYGIALLVVILVGTLGALDCSFGKHGSHCSATHDCWRDAP
jgi:Flp pilus assembly pilin Flp